MAGLTSSGFEIKRLPEIKSELESEFRAQFPGLSVVPESVAGQIIGLMSQNISDLWEILEAIYLSQYPGSAEGFSLDNVAQLTGIVRLAATKSQAPAILNGAEGTVVPDLNQASVNETGDLFEQVGAVTITKSVQLKTVISVDTVLNLQLYTVTINSVGYTFTSDADATAEEIAAGLVASINIGQTDVDATDNNDGTFTLIVADLVNLDPYSVAVDVNLAIDELWTPALYTSKETGAIVANAGTLQIIVNPVTGFYAIDNLKDATLGRDLETDTELRTRRAESLAISGAGTLESIKAGILQDVASVTAVIIFENRTDITDGYGRPPHSFEVVVQGGTDQDIADKIWELKPAGIATFGNVAVDVTDSQGDLQQMKFSRPTDKFAWVDVQITLNPEESFPVDGLDQVRNNILEFAESEYSVGDDFILQKLYAPIYGVPGIASAVVTIAITATAAPVTGTTDGTLANKLIDSGASFLTTAIAGMKAKNTTDATEATIVSVDSDTQLTLDADIFITGENYSLEKNLQASNISIGEVAVLKWDIDRITAAI